MTRLRIALLAATVTVAATVYGAPPASADYVSGCTAVTDSVHGHTGFGFTSFYFRNTVRWCWAYGRITAQSHSTTVDSVDHFYDYQGLIENNHGYFGHIQYPFPYSSIGGYYSGVKGKFMNCFGIGFIQVCQAFYPWSHIRAYSGGYYTTAHGGGG